MPDSVHTECPACHGRLYPKVLHCADCGLDVTTRYAGNEFADLDADDLHLLRIFVVCEGRIRDMESALGVSYPTVKSRLAALRGRLGLATEAAKGGAEAPSAAADKGGVVIAADAADPATPSSSARPSPGASASGAGSVPNAEATAREILDALASGATTYDEALAKIRALRGRP